MAGDPADDLLRRDCFYSYRGKHFICNSFNELSDEEIIFAARFSGDWYHYSILIHSYDALRYIMKQYKDPEKINEETRRKINEPLIRAAGEDISLHLIHGYFM